ncbi:MAG: oligosaccharide flippase family protein [bacterium]
MSHSKTYKVLLLSSSKLVRSIVVIVCAMVLSRVLILRDYATYQQSLLVYQFAAPIMMLGLHQSLFYFLSVEKERAKCILFEHLSVLFVMGTVFSLFLLVGGRHLIAWMFNNPSLNYILLLFAPYPFFVLPVNAINSCLVTRDRVQELVIYNISSRIIIVTVIVSSTLIWRTTSAAILSTVIGYGIVFFPGIALMWNSCKEGELHPRFSEIISILEFSGPLALSEAMGTISKALDKVVVSSLCLPEEFALYVNGAIEVPLIDIVVGSIASVITPEMAGYYKNDSIDNVIQTWSNAIIRSASVLLPTMGFILVLAPELITLLFSSRYLKSAYTLRVYALNLPIRSIAFGAIFIAINKPKVILHGTLFVLLINLVLTLLFVPLLGATGAAWATVISLWSMAVYYFLWLSKFSGKTMSQMIAWKSVRKLAFPVVYASCLSLLLGYIFPMEGMIKLIVTSAFYFCFVSIIYIRSGVFDIASIMKTIRLRLKK